MTRLELTSWCSLAALAALSTTAAAAPKKPKKPGAAPAASAPPAASSAPAPPPAPAPSAPSPSVTDEDSEHVSAAPEPGEKKLAVGADLLFVLPVGDLSSVTGPQIGPLLRVGYRFMPQLEATGRIGYLFALGTSVSLPGGFTANASVTDIPVWLGARYFFMEAPAGAYAAAEIGMNFLTANASGTVNAAAKSQSVGDTRAGFNLAGGYVWSKELPIDVRLQFSYYNLIGTAGGESALLGIGLSAGYSFFF